MGTTVDDNSPTPLSYTGVTVSVTRPTALTGLTVSAARRATLSELTVSPPRKCLEPRRPADPDIPPPKVVSTYPAKGAVVRPGVLVLRLTFDLPMGCEIEVVSPADYPHSLPLITYSEIRLALGARDDVEERFLTFAPDAVHIATEGTLGWDARAVCLKHKFPFTTSYHTQFPEYVTARFNWIPLWAGCRRSGRRSVGPRWRRPCRR